MLDFTQTIEQAEKLGFEYMTGELFDYFDFPKNRVSFSFSGYIHSLSGFHWLTSLVKENLSKVNENIKNAHDNAQEGARALNVKTGTTGEPWTTEHVALMKQIFGSVLGSVEVANEVYLSMYVITLVSKFEAYIQNIVSEISKYYPATMKSGKMVSINEILQHKKMPSLIEYLAESTSSKSTEGVATEYICRLGGKYGISICQFKDLISEVEYFVDIRHVLVHKNGVIDSQYHFKYPHAGDLGKSINLSFDLLAQMSHVFRLTVNLIEVMLIEKFPKLARVSAVIDDDGNVDDIFVELERICLNERNSFAE